MRQVYDRSARIARSNATVLLRGESGTGKEFVAGTIHFNSLRSKRAFIKINCNALSETLLDAELFGEAENGKGAFESADGGTLFIEEIAAVPKAVQTKLLKLLKEGDDEISGPNVRLIFSSSRDLERAVADGGLSKGLFEEIRKFTILMPPLRERTSDILLLAEHFLEKYERQHGKSIRRLSTPAIDMLASYHFPGNVRELENVIERAVIECDSNVIHGHHLPPMLQTAEISGTATRLTLSAAVEAFEKDMILDVLKSSRGNIAKAAIMLDSTERILGYKVKKYGISPSRYRK
jgi:Nif-specific regulatory protein